MKIRRSSGGTPHVNEGFTEKLTPSHPKIPQSGLSLEIAENGRLTITLSKGATFSDWFSDPFWEG
jgi:hypothetical protein